jgi:nucleoside-diphosphate-sugar epimerase
VGKTIAITGANGFLGAVLVDYFLEQGWKVVALVRHIPAKSDNKNLSYKEYDVRRPVDKKMFEGVDYVIHAAYIKQDRKNPDAFVANVQGAKNLLAAVRASGTKKNIFISSMSSHEGAISSYGRQKLAIEKLFDTPADTSLRLGLIIGNGGIVRNMAAFMRSKHVVPLIGGGKQPLQVINVHDVGKTIQQTIKYDTRGTLTIATPQVYTYKEFYKALAKHLGVGIVFIPLPSYLLLAMIKAIGALHLPLAINAESVQGLKKLIAVDTSKDLKKLHLELDSLDTSLRQFHLDKATGNT